MYKVCVDVGHTPAKPGAAAQDGVTEYEQNMMLANLIAQELHAIELIPVVVYRDTYSNLPNLINATHADICISVHANAASTPLATGTETLYYEHSERSKSLATVVQKEMIDCLGLRDRGLKGLGLDDRGYSLVKKTNMPHVIIEPYFLSNKRDTAIANSKMDELAECIASACSNYLP
jgi:N-acetylmuramoyl-L-alanine amidase